MRNKNLCWGVAGLAALTLAMFADVLFGAGDRVLSGEGLDLAKQFIHWRTFGFQELRHGNLALWNPHIFSGAPFFGGFQSALLYPPNALFLALPLAKAVNWSVALHVFLAGTFTLAWGLRRGLHPWAAFLAGVTFMFCGAHFLHIYAGHLTNLCALAWAPLIFLALDGAVESPSPGWALLGIFAVTMQILAGHPQYVFYTAIAAGVYSTLCFSQSKSRMRSVLCLGLFVVGPVCISAVQLFTAVQESSEMLRSGGLDYEAAGRFSFPPENLLTLFVPHLFGDMMHVPYWGRYYLWEMSLFIGVTAFSLAIVGAIYGDSEKRRVPVIMVIGLLILALGIHTPLFKALYHWAPGFNRFRGISKFIFLASLFLSVLSGMGLDALMKWKRSPKTLIIVCVAAGGVLGIGGMWIKPRATEGSADRIWRGALAAELKTGETYLPEKMYQDDGFVLAAGNKGSNGLIIAGVTFVTLAILLTSAQRVRGMHVLIVALSATELFVFARSSRDTFQLESVRDEAIREHVAKYPGDYRILNLRMPNAAMSIGAQDLWGDDPGVLKRYAELMAYSQEVDPDHPVQFLPIRHDSPIYSMFRRRFTFAPQETGSAKRRIFSNTNALPRLQLVYQISVLTNRNEIFGALSDPAFDPRRMAILESAPSPVPGQPRETDAAHVVSSSTDRLEIEAEVSDPALLLVTDAYSRQWTARAIPGSSQETYRVMPANYCLRAIPLAAGKHHIRMEYRPSGFVLGKWVSIFALGFYLGAVVVWTARRKYRGQGWTKRDNAGQDS